MQLTLKIFFFKMNREHPMIDVLPKSLDEKSTVKIYGYLFSGGKGTTHWLELKDVISLLDIKILEKTHAAVTLKPVCG